MSAANSAPVHSTSMYGMDGDTVILSQLMSTLNEAFSCRSGGLVNILKALGGGMVKLCASLFVHRMYKSGDVWSIVRFLLMRFAYKRTQLTPSDRSTSAIQEFTSLLPNKPDFTIVQEVSVRGMPVYMEKEATDHVLYTCPILHSTFLTDLLSRAEKDVVQRQHLNTVCRDTNGKAFDPQPLFASNNYMALAKRVKNYFTRKSTGMITPPLIVLQGAAGLGKTDSFQYLAGLGICGEIRVISLTSDGMASKSFSSILRDLLCKRYATPTVVYFDELDKYVDMYVQHTYTTRALAPKSGAMDEVVNEDYGVFVASVKKSVLMSIASLIENWHSSFPEGVVYVFCSNNFHTLFQGIDNTHVDSIKTRFTFIQFEKCGKDELCRYLREYNNRLSEGEKYSDNEMKECCAYIRPDLCITYRDIQIIMGMAGYEVRDFVKIVNERVNNPLFHIIEEGGVNSGGGGISSEMSESSAVYTKPKTAEERKNEKEIAMKVGEKMIRVINDSNVNDVECMDKVMEITRGYDLVELMEQQIPIYDKDLSGDDPVDYVHGVIETLQAGRVALFRYLIHSGLDVYLFVYEDTLPAHCCRVLFSKDYRTGVSECIEMLIDAGMDIVSSLESYSKRLRNINPSNTNGANALISVIRKVKRVTPEADFDPIAFFVHHPEFNNTIRDLVNEGVTLHKNVLSDVYTKIGLYDVDLSSTIDLLIELGADKNMSNRTSNFLTTPVRSKYKNRLPETVLYMFNKGITITLSDGTKIDSVEAYADVMAKSKNSPKVKEVPIVDV